MSISSKFPYKHIPYKIKKEDQQTLCYWIYAGDTPYVEPFFQESLGAMRSALRTPNFNSVSSMDMMKIWGEDIDAIAPTAFIFHVSRCGSTLLTQMLGTDVENIVLAEVPFFDALLRLRYQANEITGQEISDLLKVAFKYYGQKRTGKEKQLFVKLDSWHICFYEQLRALFPDVPFILLYRTPNEVLDSHRKLRGMQAVPGVIEPEVFGFDKENMVRNNLDTYMGTVLERYFKGFINIAENDPLAMLLNYNEGITVMMEKLAAFAGITFNEEQLEAMHQRSKFHSKFPDQVFNEDRGQEIPSYLEKVMALYGQVELKRLENNN